MKVYLFQMLRIFHFCKFFAENLYGKNPQNWDILILLLS